MIGPQRHVSAPRGVGQLCHGRSYVCPIIREPARYRGVGDAESPISVVPIISFRRAISV
jgi:hypothetical protein